MFASSNYIKLLPSVPQISKPKAPQVTSLISAIFLLSLPLFPLLTIMRKIVFGSWSGGFTYLYTGSITIHTLIVAIISLILVNIALYISLEIINRQHNLSLAICFLVGFIIQIIIFSLAPHSYSQIINSNTANSFYTPVFLYDLSDLLGDFNSSLSRMEIHTSANMPGKIITFYALNYLTSSPEIIGYLITLISSLGSLLVFFISENIFKNSKTALLAMFFYLLIPSKQLFLPLLNTITPVLILFPFMLFLSFLKTQKPSTGFLFGLSLFLLFMYEPTPLMLLLSLVPVTIFQLNRHQIAIKKLIKFSSLSMAVFSLCVISLIHKYNYNPITTMAMMVKRAYVFNQLNNRPCNVWLLDNLKDLFITSGPAQSTAFLILALSALSSLSAKNRSRKSIELLALSTFGVIILINFMMINCGETIRLWIFLSVFVNVFAAYSISKLLSVKTWHWILSITLIQTVVTQSLVNFISP